MGSQSLSDKRFILLGCVVSLLGVLLLGFTKGTPRIYQSDEIFYLKHAYALKNFGVYALPKVIPPAAPLEPGGVAAPLYPAALSLLMLGNSAFDKLAECQILNQASCPPGLGLAFPLQLLLGGISTALIFLAGLYIARSRVAAVVAGTIYALSGVPVYYASRLLTENLFLPLTIAFCIAFVLAYRKRSIWWGCSAGLLAGLAALTRPQMFYIGALLAIGFLVVSIYIWKKFDDRKIIAAAMGLLVAFGVVAGSWTARNSMLVGKSGFSSSYGAGSLAGRVAYNDMTAKEWLMAWIYWLPDFGDKAGEALFGKAAVNRLYSGSPEGFYLAGTKRMGKIVQQETGFDIFHKATDEQGIRKDPLAWLLKEKVLGEFHRHLPVTLVLAWRGVFVEKYIGLLGLISLLWVLMSRQHSSIRRDMFILSLTPVLLLGLQAFVSLNIPRYNLVLLLPMLLAIGAVSQNLVERWQSRHN